MPGWEQLGMQAAGQGLSAGLGLLLQGQQDRRQLRQQEKLQNLQIAGNKQLTDYNFMKQMEMWRNTNYPAQMAMLKAAGLNPALMYKSGGDGGTTAISQGSVTGGNAPTGGGEIQAMMAMGLTRQLQQAQIENIKASTEKTKAETTAVAPGIQKTQAETASLTQGIENAKAQQELTKVQTNIASIDEHIKGKTQNAVVAQIETTLRQATEILESLERENDINNQTKQTKIGLIRQELANKVIEWWKTKADITAVGQAIAHSVNNIQMAIQQNMREWDKLGLDTQQNTLNRYGQMLQDQGFPQELKNILDNILIIPKIGKK